MTVHLLMAAAGASAWKSDAADWLRETTGTAPDGSREGGSHNT